MATVSAKALFEGKAPITLHTRVAGDLVGGFLYDLANQDWQAIHTTPTGWEVTQPPLMFRRFGHQVAQCMPIPGGDMTKILEYIPVKESSFLFFAG